MAVSAVALRSHRRALVLIILLVLALYAVLPQLGGFRSAWQILLQASWPTAAVAISFTALTYALAAATYRLLAFQVLPYGQLVLVELAAMFINRLLPGGIGALGVNYAYLCKHGHRATQAASVITLNNLLGILGHSLLLIVTLISFSAQATVLPDHHWSAQSFITVAGFVMVLAVLAFIVNRNRFLRLLHDIGKQSLSYRRRPRQLSMALLSSIALTLCNVLCLVFCASSLGVHVSFVAALLVFSFGIGAGTITPTPGGLGGFEAGLVAGFVAYHVPASTALALALLYRFVSYWLPLMVGALAFTIAQRRRLFTV